MRKRFFLINSARTSAGLPPFKADSRLKDAARLHLIQFVKNQQISKQYADEPSIQERMRIANIHQVDFIGRTVRLFDSKNGECRGFPFTPKLESVLQKQHEKSEKLKRTN